MVPLLFVTQNENKFEEVAHVLAPQIEVARKDFAFIEDTDLPIEEIAKEKARQAFHQFKTPLIVEDTGVFFEAYQNFPGPIAKRVYTAIGPEGLLKLVEGKNRHAFFETVIVFTDNTTTQVFTGKTSGTLMDFIASPNERFKFGYERIIVPDGFEKPLSQFSLKEKNAISHRGKAAGLFKAWFLKEKRLL